MEYEPEYAKGQIVVIWKVNIGKEFGETLGYKFLGNDYTNQEIFKTPEEGEEKVGKHFMKYPEFVETFYLRDLKLERRWESLEEPEQMLNSLRDTCEKPTQEYNQALEEIINYLENCKE